MDCYNIVFDNPWGGPNFVTSTKQQLVEEIEEGYGLTPNGETVEDLAKQWCELKGLGFVRIIKKDTNVS